jgi:branched-chain amino acid transport system substrate-binding protein
MNARRISLIASSLVIVGLVLLNGAAWATPERTGSLETAAPTTAAPVKEGTPYKIGVCAAITGSGSSLGLPQRNTAEMLAQQYASGIVGSDGVHHDLKFIIYDTESKPDTASSVASRLIKQDEADVLICDTQSGTSAASVPIATENQVPMISMASARSIMADPATGKMRKWIFKVAPDQLQSGEWQAVYLKAKGITTVCDLYENSGYGQDCLAQTTKALKAAGIAVAYSDAFEPGDTQFPQMSSVQVSGCKAIVVGAIPPGASMVTVAARETLPDLPVIAGHGVCNEDFIKLAGQSAEGVVFPCGRLMVADVLPDTDPGKLVVLKYIADYSAFTNGKPISTFGGHAWDAITMSLEALKSLKEGLSLSERRAAVRDYLENNVKNWPGQGGLYNITPDDHMGLKYDSMTFVKVVDGKWKYFPPEQW